MTYRDDSQAHFDKRLSPELALEGETTSRERNQKVIKRTRHSFYLDAALVHSLDQAYRQVHHDLYPVEIGKSDFLEACIRYALSYLQEIKCNFTRNE